MNSLHPMTDFANRLLSRPVCVDLALVRQDESAIRQGQSERRELRARALAGQEVAECLTAMRRLDRPITANLGPGLAEVALNTYLDYLRGTR